MPMHMFSECDIMDWSNDKTEDETYGLSTLAMIMGKIVHRTL